MLTEKSEKVKVMLRRLPKYMTEKEVMEQISPLPEEVVGTYFYPANFAFDHASYASLALVFSEYCNSLMDFERRFDGYIFVDSRGNDSASVVEAAVNQNFSKCDRGRMTEDTRVGAILNDKYYLEFCEKLNLEKAVPIMTLEQQIRKLNQPEDARTQIDRLETPLVKYSIDKEYRRRSDYDVRKAKRELKKAEKHKNPRNLLLLLFVFSVEMAKRGNFATDYELLAASIHHHGAVWEAQLQNWQNTLKLNIVGLANSTVRILIDDSETAIHERYVPTPSFLALPEELAFESVENGQQEAKIVGGNKKLKVVIRFKPFMVNVFNEFNELIVQINRHQKLKILEFKSFANHKQFGSSSVGVDITFVSFKTAYGLPEQADTFARLNTGENIDPYRLYSAIEYSYALFGLNCPFFMAHKDHRAAGFLWNSARKTVFSKDSRNRICKFDKKGNVENCFEDSIYELVSEDGIGDILVFSGPRKIDILNQYWAVVRVDNSWIINSYNIDVYYVFSWIVTTVLIIMAISLMCVNIDVYQATIWSRSTKSAPSTQNALHLNPSEFRVKQATE